jgi:SAM-dependent methyltransferase
MPPDNSIVLLIFVFMINAQLKVDGDVTDEEFNAIYPEAIQRLANRHWTSVSVAKTVSAFLAERPGTRVLDIGSGVGKFCMVGALYTKGHFVGVEQRDDLVQISRNAAHANKIKNVSFIHANITSIPFREYDAFYFFNPFHEHVALHGHIDSTMKRDLSLYESYCLYVYEQFSSLPIGARVATMQSNTDVVPDTFRLVRSLKKDSLNYWEKYTF